MSARRDTPAPTYHDIARRAYELYVRRGAQPGHEQEDWFQAERDLRVQKPQSV